MKTVQQTLIGLFAHNSVEELTGNKEIIVKAFGVANYDAVKALRDYNTAFGRVNDAKRTIECFESDFRGDMGKQALECLTRLKDLRLELTYPPVRYLSSADERNEFKNYFVFSELVSKTLYLKWPNEIRDEFDKRFTVLNSWTDFFFSYTNRNAHATNNRYKDLIRDNYRWEEGSENPTNHVARVIVKYLEREEIHGFSDYNNLRCGDDIEDEISNHCRATIGFVQLVEDITLTVPYPPKKNWCFEEYEQFIRGLQPMAAPAELGNRCFFTLAGCDRFRAPAVLAPSYQDWYDNITRLLAIVLDDCMYGKFDALKLKVYDVAVQIIDARNMIFESMVAPFPYSH